MPGADTERLPEDAAWKRTRDFTLLWGGSGISQLGNVGAAIAAPLLALSVTGSPVLAGAVAAAGTLPSLLLHLPAGMIVDRFDRRLLMLTCQGLRCAVALALTCGLLVLSAPWPLLIAAAAADGALAAVYNLAEVTVIGRLVPDGQLVAAMARNEARHHTALLLGRPLGGFLFDLGRVVPFAVNAVLALLAALSIGAIKAENIRSAEPSDAPGAGGGFAECMALLWRDVFLRRVLVICAITNFAFQTIFLLLMVQADRQIASNAMIGVLFAASGLGGLLGSLAARRFLPGRQPRAVVLLCVWGWAAMTGVVALLDRPLTGLAAWAGISFIGAHMNVALTTYRAARIPDDLLARMASVNTFVTRGAVPLGALFAGYLLSTVPSTRFAAVMVAAITLVVAVTYTLRGRWVRRAVRRARRSIRREPAAPMLDPEIQAGTKSRFRAAENMSHQR